MKGAPERGWPCRKRALENGGWFLLVRGQAAIEKFLIDISKQ
jgi:hypothetical protein